MAYYYEKNRSIYQIFPVFFPKTRANDTVLIIRFEPVLYPEQKSARAPDNA